jgi:two-component system LytT family response regulator
VDDEPLARQRLRSLLKNEPDFEIVSECANGREAVAAIRDLEPDLVFLDVQMPGMNGFGVLEAVGPDRMPPVIFVTAYDSYALRAFEVHALDYLLKPFDRDRFGKALKRVKEEMSARMNQQAGEKLAALLEQARTDEPGSLAGKLKEASSKHLQEEVQKGRKSLDRLVIKSAGRVFFLRADEIDWIEAAGNYLRLHSGGETHLLRDTMNNLEARLNPAKFVRIHRSTIVNLERIKELNLMFHGDYLVVLQDGTELTLSRSYRPKLQELLGDSF